jgi:hypothetical protein
MFVGYENSSTSLNMVVMTESGEKVTEIGIGREHDGEPPSVVDTLAEHVDLDEVKQIAVAGYYWADNFSEIQPIEKVERDVSIDTIGLGPVPLNTQFYDEFTEAGLPAVVYPGINNDLLSLHPYFGHYPVLAGADRVADIRYAKAFLEQQGAAGENFIVTNASSSNVASLVIDGAVRGTFHWIGLNHGWIGTDMLRRLDSGDMSAETALLRSGHLYRPDTKYGAHPVSQDREEKRIKDISDDTPNLSDREKHTSDDEPNLSDREKLERVYWSTLHNVYSLQPFVTHVYDTQLEGIVLMGRLSRHTEPFDLQGQLTEALSDIAPTYTTEPFSCAMGAAHFAKDVYEGASDVLGIPVNERAEP